jgi:hypothetical protein
MRPAICFATAALALCLFVIGCKSNGDDLSGFWTLNAQNGGQITQIKMEKGDNGYRMISIPGLQGKCVTTDQPMPMRIADKNEVADMQIKGLQEALLDTDNRYVKFYVGPKGDWAINDKHITSGYAFDLGDGPREVHRTDGCYALDGKLVQQ